MTKDEIKKGLELCKAGWCVMCPYCNCIGCEGFLKQDALTLITEQEKEIERLKDENKENCWKCIEAKRVTEEDYAKLQEEFANYQIASDKEMIAQVKQAKIDVLNELKTKAFDKDAFNGWAGSTFVVLVRDIDKMIEELTNC